MIDKLLAVTSPELLEARRCMGDPPAGLIARVQLARPPIQPRTLTRDPAGPT
jgi:hypothetical protein